MCLEVLEVGFYWERLGRGLVGPIVSSKAVAKDLKMKFGSKFNHGCFHCAILKAYKARDMQFFP